MHKLLSRFPDQPEQDEYLARDVIVPRFLDYFLTAYRMALESGPGAVDPDADRRELRFLLSLSRSRPLSLNILASIPYALARPVFELSKKLPWRIRRHFRRAVAPLYEAGAR
jgi:hypothetical protein